MMLFQACLQTIAAISAAIAAVAAARATRGAFSFQKKLLLKKAVVEQIAKLLQQIHYFKSLADQPALQVGDDDFSGVGDRIREVRDGVKVLQSMTTALTSKEIVIICDTVNGLRPDHVFALDGGADAGHVQKLDAAINALEDIFHKEAK